MPHTCAVINCGSCSVQSGRRFYRFPMIDDSSNDLLSKTTARQQSWLVALNRNNFFEYQYKHARVCDLHFISGKSADLLDVHNPDWVPSLNLGYADDYDSNQEISKDNDDPDWVPSSNLGYADDYDSNEENSKDNDNPDRVPSLNLGYADDYDSNQENSKDNDSPNWVTSLNWGYAGDCESNEESSKDNDNPHWVPSLNLGYADDYDSNQQNIKDNDLQNERKVNAIGIQNENADGLYDSYNTKKTEDCGFTMSQKQEIYSEYVSVGVQIDDNINDTLLMYQEIIAHLETQLSAVKNVLEFWNFGNE